MMKIQQNRIELVTRSSTTSIKVTWVAPPPASAHGVIQGYKVMYGPSDTWYDPATRELKFSKKSRADLTGLKKFTNYTVTALAFTKGGGDGVKSPVVAVMTEEDVPGPVSDVKALPMSHDSILVRSSAICVALIFFHFAFCIKGH